MPASKRMELTKPWDLGVAQGGSRDGKNMTRTVLRTSLLAALLGALLPQLTAATVSQNPGSHEGVTGPSPHKIDEERARASGVAFEYDTPPKPTRTKRPEYPKSAFQKGIEGTVLVEIVIDRRGRVVEPRVLTSVPQLDGAALKCIKAWRFEPATKDGQPVATIAHVPIVFKIKVEGAAREKQTRE